MDIKAFFEYIRDFMELGGPVLYLIAALLVVMWYMILERIMYINGPHKACLLYTSPSPRDRQKSRMPSSA